MEGSVLAEGHSLYQGELGSQQNQGDDQVVQEEGIQEIYHGYV